MEGLSLSGRRREGVELTSLSSFRSLQALSRIAYDIVRLALFHEQKKIGLSRTDINKKGTYGRMASSRTRAQGELARDPSSVPPLLTRSSSSPFASLVIQEKHKAGARVFNDVFPLAQKILRKTFGMELFELRKSGKAADQDDDTGPANKKGKKRAIAEDEEEEAEEGEGKKKKKGELFSFSRVAVELEEADPSSLLPSPFALSSRICPSRKQWSLHASIHPPSRSRRASICRRRRGRSQA